MDLKTNEHARKMLEFLKAGKCTQPYLHWDETREHLGIGEKEFDTLLRALQQRRLVNAGIGNVGITLDGEDFIASPEEKAEIEQRSTRLYHELEAAVVELTRQEISVTHIHEEITGKQSNGRNKAYSNTGDLARKMGEDPCKLKTAALHLERQGRVEVPSHWRNLDSIAVRIKPEDIKVLMQAHGAIYDIENGKAT